MSRQVFWALVLLMFVLGSFAALQTARKRDVDDDDEEEPNKPATRSVTERGLLESVSAFKIIKEHSRFSINEQNKKNFKGKSLGFITPWNAKGYDLALKFPQKFDLLSPCWYQLKQDANFKPFLQGKEGVNRKWLQQIQEANPKVGIIPRFIIEWDSGEQVAQKDNEQLWQGFVDLIVNELKQEKYAGVMVDFGGLLQAHFSPLMITFLRQLGTVLRQNNFLLIVAAPPVSSAEKSALRPQHIQEIIKDVDYLVLMTYDFSGPGRTGPVAPLHWTVNVLNNILPPAMRQEWAPKFLLGVNFYGMKYQHGAGNAIVAHEFLSLISEKPKEVRVEYMAQADEHIFKFPKKKGDLQVFYPTLKSIFKRLEMFQMLGVGVSVWELGQGLDYWMDLF
eukprot:TRINITY_DN2590_c0_g1_i1.p1 TRINITY_DN2590_c0_g1~~TRINITY_DN2590_c0_g1_i1.p1  ORF type:complete len:392 (-),score=105.47 TRINITY_DN2590_c0_g1_i1:83-1258(-)